MYFLTRVPLCIVLLLLVGSASGQDPPPHVLLVQRMIRALPQLIAAQAQGNPSDFNTVWNQLVGRGLLRNVLEPDNVQRMFEELLKGAHIQPQAHLRPPVVIGGSGTRPTNGPAFVGSGRPSLFSFDTAGRGERLFSSSEPGAGLFGLGGSGRTNDPDRLPLLPRHLQQLLRQRQLQVNRAAPFDPLRNRPLPGVSPFNPNGQQFLELAQPVPLQLLPDAARLISQVTQELLRQQEELQLQAANNGSLSVVNTTSETASDGTPSGLAVPSIPVLPSTAQTVPEPTPVAHGALPSRSSGGLAAAVTPAAALVSPVTGPKGISSGAQLPLMPLQKLASAAMISPQAAAAHSASVPNGKRNLNALAGAINGPKVNVARPPKPAAQAAKATDAKEKVEFTKAQIAQLQELLHLLRGASSRTTASSEAPSSPSTPPTTILNTTTKKTTVTTTTTTTARPTTQPTTAVPTTTTTVHKKTNLAVQSLFSIDRESDKAATRMVAKVVTQKPRSVVGDDIDVLSGCTCMPVDLRMMKGIWVQAFGNPENMRMIYQGIHRLRSTQALYTAEKPQCVAFRFGEPHQTIDKQVTVLEWFYQLPSSAEPQKILGSMTTRNHKKLMMEIDQLGGYKFTLPFCVVKAEIGPDQRYDYMVLVETLGKDKCRSAHVLVRKADNLFHPTHEPLINFLKKRVSSGLMKSLSVLPQTTQCAPKS